METKKLKIYLDNYCYNRPFDEVRNTEIDMEIIVKLAIQLMIQQGKLDLVWSYALTYENSFDYTEWRKTNVHENTSVRELSKKAMEVENEKK